MKKSLPISAAVAALLTLGTTAPALAAQERVLPAGETLYAVDCQDNIGQVGTVDTTTAVVTPLGTGNDDEFQDCAADGGYDPVSGFAYYPAWDNVPNSLYKVNVTDGSSTYIAEIEFPDGSSNNVDDTTGGIMFDADGNGYISFTATDSNDDFGQWIGRLNVTTGEITDEHKVTLDGTWVTNDNLWSGDYNPADGKIYLINQTELLEVDPATGVAISHGDNGDNTYWYGLAIDSNGILWSTGTDYVTSSTVDGWSTSGTEQSSENRTAIDGNWYSESNFIVWDADTNLAETGVDANAIALTAAAFVVAGAAVLAVRRREHA